MTREAKDNTSFPRWVALASLGLTLLLFFANTVPALRERGALRELGDELADLRRRYDDAIREVRHGLGPRADYDLQSLLVAIDEHGFTPLELCAAHPEQKPTSPPPDESAPPADLAPPAELAGTTDPAGEPPLVGDGVRDAASRRASR